MMVLKPILLAISIVCFIVVIVALPLGFVGIFRGSLAEHVDEFLEKINCPLKYKTIERVVLICMTIGFLSYIALELLNRFYIG